MPILRCEFYVTNGEHLDLFCLWTCGWHRHMNAWTKSTTTTFTPSVPAVASHSWRQAGSSAAEGFLCWCDTTCIGHLLGNPYHSHGGCSRDWWSLQQGLWGTFLFSSAGTVRGKSKFILFYPACQLPSSSPVSWKWPVLTLESRNHTFFLKLVQRVKRTSGGQI